MANINSNLLNMLVKKSEKKKGSNIYNQRWFIITIKETIKLFANLHEITVVIDWILVNAGGVW